MFVSVVFEGARIRRFWSSASLTWLDHSVTSLSDRCKDVDTTLEVALPQWNALLVCHPCTGFQCRRRLGTGVGLSSASALNE